MKSHRSTARRVRILGVPVNDVDMATCLEMIDQRIASHGKTGCVLAMNPEKVVALQRNIELRQLFEKAFLLIPDGIGVVLAMRVLHGTRSTRVPGVDLMRQVCRNATEKGHKVYVYGSREAVNKEAVERLRRIYPGILIVGRHHGYVSADGMANLIDEINSSGANILFVALGSPMQEQWIQHHLTKLTVNICQGIGGSLDALVGKTKRAPVLFQKVGLEWFYRLLREPGRIRRQMVLPLFAAKVLLSRIIHADHYHDIP